MKSNLQEEIIDLSALVRSAADSAELPSATASANQEANLQPDGDTPAEIVPLDLHEELHGLFKEFRHLLRYLKLIEGNIMQEGGLHKTVLIFRLIYERSLFLIDRMNTLAAQVGSDHAPLRDAIDATGFALKHEIRRVYEVEAAGLSKAGNTRFSGSELIRAYRLLQNCFQQSAIALTQVLNPRLNGETLFEDYKVKREQSLVLYRELMLLLQKVCGIEKEAGVLQMLNVITSLKRFRQEIMHFLMYKDWEEFENFVDEIEKTYDDERNLAPVLHRFALYLETLLKHVSMRAVLNDKHLRPTEISS